MQRKYETKEEYLEANRQRSRQRYEDRKQQKVLYQREYDKKKKLELEQLRKFKEAVLGAVAELN